MFLSRIASRAAILPGVGETVGAVLIKAFSAFHPAGRIAAAYPPKAPDSRCLFRAKNGEAVLVAEESRSPWQVDAEKWDVTAERDEETGEDMEDNQRQGPPIDMIKSSTEPFFFSRTGLTTNSSPRPDSRMMSPGEQTRSK